MQSGTRASCRYLFISSASLSWIEANFLNQNLCIPLCPGFFPVWYLFSVFLSSLMCISAFGPSSSSSSSLAISFIHSAFLLCFFGCHIFVQNRSVSLVVGMFLCHGLPIVDRIFFRCFGMSCFVCIVLPFVDISLVFLLSLEPSGLFPQVARLFFSCCLFHSLPTYSRIFLFYYSGLFS